MLSIDESLNSKGVMACNVSPVAMFCLYRVDNPTRAAADKRKSTDRAQPYV